jgi:hypothetical protein
MNTTNQGVLNDAQYDIDDAADALLNRWTDAKQPSEKREEEEPEVTEDEQNNVEETKDEQEPQEPEETEEETETDEEAETDEETEEQADDSEDKESPKVQDDDAEIEVTVGQDKHKVKVKELTRLYGQEAALTRKSQEVATQRKEVEAQAAKHAAVLDQLHQRAQAKWEPYSKIDMLLASKELDTDTFAALRKEAQEAYEEFQFVSLEADKFMQQAQAMQQERVKAQAQEAVKVLKEKIPNWSNELYDKVRTYAVDNGFDPKIAANITDPNAILMMHKAMLFDAGKNIKLKPKAKVPTKVIKSSNTAASDIKPNKNTQAMNRLKASGQIDDAVDAFMARWGQ